MADGDASRDAAAELRRRAEEMSRQARAQGGDIPPAEALSLLHELQVHQIELELQNAELRRTQDELAASHARYFELFDLAPVGYLTLDAEGLIREANLAAADLLGVDRSRLVKQPLTRFIHRDDQDIYYLHQKRLPRTQQAETCELRLQSGAGAARWVQMRSVRADDRAATVVCRVTLTDLSERKAAEQLRFRAGLLESIDEAVVVVDLDMVVMYWNRRAEELYGWPAKETLGHRLSEVLVPQTSSGQAEVLAAGLRAGRPWSGEIEVRHKLGAVRTVYFAFSPVKDYEGKLVGAVAVLHDPTRRPPIENDLRLSREELRNLTRRLVAAQETERRYVAHQLLEDDSQSLAVLLLQLGALKREAAAYPALVNHIGELEMLVDGLMQDLHRLAGSLRSAALDRLGLRRAVTQYAEEFGQKQHLRISCRFPGLRDGALPREVETAFYRVVQEALSNVALHARASEVTILVGKRQGSLFALIEDNGIGFDVEDALRWGRAGLIEMRERVEALEGRLYVESSPGQGATINAVVPDNRPAATGNITVGRP